MIRARPRESSFPVRCRKILYYKPIEKRRVGRKRNNEKYLDLLWYIDWYTHRNGYAPTYREIMVAQGMSSTSVVHYYLNGLEDMGLIARKKHKPRTLRVL